MKKLLIALLLFLITAPAIAQTQINNVFLDIVPPTNRPSLAITTNRLFAWTNVAYSDPTITGFSGHTVVFRPNIKPVQYASILLVIDDLDGTCQARLTSNHWEGPNLIWDYGWPIMLVPTNQHPNRIEYDVTAKFNTSIANSSAINQITMDLMGSCKLYSAKLELNWAQP